jgi:hypothetical protein
MKKRMMEEISEWSENNQVKQMGMADAYKIVDYNDLIVQVHSVLRLWDRMEMEQNQ